MKSEQRTTEKTKQNDQLESGFGRMCERENAPRVEDAIAGCYKSAFQTEVAQAQSRIKARR